jgi:protoporphyrinogen oxidase
VLGAGPAGLTAAYVLARNGHEATVFEADGVVGGIAKTVEFKGYRFDLGGHRFFTKLAPIDRLWHTMLGDEFVTRPRLSRIYYQGKFFDYPINAGQKSRSSIVRRGESAQEGVRVSWSITYATGKTRSD